MKKEVFVLTVLVLLTLGLTAGAVYQQKHHQNVTDAAVVKAQKAVAAAKSELVTDQFNLQAANNQLQTVTTQKVAVCTVLKAHKLTDPNCP